jgi:long-chain acyl-CoA synthetase
VSGSDSEATLKVSGTLRRLVQMEGEFADWISTPSDGGPGPVIQRLEALKPDDVVTLIYTSGTTGQPKGVVLAHRNFVDMARATLQVFDVGEHDVSLSFLPYSHVFERMSGIFVGIMGGGSSYLSRGIDLLGEDLGQVKPTLMMSVPRVYEKMYARVQQQVGNAPPHKQALFRWAIATGKRSLKGRANPLQGIQQRLAERIVLAPLRQRLSGGRLRFFVSGGAPLNPEIEEFFWAIGIPILQGWGLTETTSGATSNTEKDHRLGTVGKAFPGVELKIAGDGEILVKGPGVMLGYHDSPKATAEVLEDGWFRSGDIGELDKAGFLKITDRKKDLLKTAGGKYVAPQPIESRLQDDSLIERAVLIGDGRPYVTALIVPDWEALKREQKLSGEPEQLSQDEKVRAVFQGRVDAVNKGLGSWETIKYFQLLAEDFSEARGEMTPTLKVRRRAVQEHHKAAIESMYQDKEKPGKAQRKSEQGARRNG